jgi:hypothetical protein
MRTYELIATPLISPGETVRARVAADPANAREISVALRALVYGAGDALAPMDSERVLLSPGDETVLAWRLPDTGGQPIQSIGLAVNSPGGWQDGAIVLDWLRIDGPPHVRLRRPEGPSDFWRRAWVNGVSAFSTSLAFAFRISQDRGEGMIIHGGRRWRDYRVETTLTVHLAGHAGVGVRVQGLRRYYAMLLVRPDKARLVRMRDGKAAILAEAAFPWAFETPYPFSVEVAGAQIEASIGDLRLEARDESELSFSDGGVALVIEGGASSCGEVLIAPPLRSGVADIDNPTPRSLFADEYGRSR